MNKEGGCPLGPVAGGGGEAEFGAGVGAGVGLGAACGCSGGASGVTGVAGIAWGGSIGGSKLRSNLLLEK